MQSEHHPAFYEGGTYTQDIAEKQIVHEQIGTVYTCHL